MERAMHFTDPDGRRVAGLIETPPDASDRIAVLCHGFLSNKNSMTNRTLTALLSERRIATLRFDFFGQGESEGPFEEITVARALGQTLAALDLVADKGYRRIGLVGSSFGGLVAILAAARWPANGRRLACLALKCPVPDFPEMLEQEFAQQGLAEWKATDTIPDVTGKLGRLRLRYRFYEDCVRHVAYEPARAITAPTLIVQGDRDEYVPLHQSRRLLEALRAEKRLEILPGADHGFTKPEDFRTMTTLVTDWLTAHLGGGAA
ncbi:alpha/beta hydrolase family protein [Nitrospira sp. Kam-Ns4a]